MPKTNDDICKASGLRSLQDPKPACFIQLLLSLSKLSSIHYFPLLLADFFIMIS